MLVGQLFPALLALALFGHQGALGTGVAYVAVVAVAQWLLGWANLMAPARGLRLQTIQISHFAEKVRWLLDLEGVRYTEEVDVGILGVLCTARTVPVLSHGAHRLMIGDSPQIVAYLAGSRPSSRLLEQSVHAQELCASFDAMGSAIQRSMYARLLGGRGFDTHREAALMLWGSHPQFASLTPLWQRLLLRLSWPLVLLFMRRLFKLSSADAIRSSDQLISDTFSRVSALLADGRAFLLGGDSPSVADVTFCALAGALLLPPEYGGRDSAILYETAQKLPNIISFVDMHRATPSAKWVLEFYRTWRFKKMEPSSN